MKVTKSYESVFSEIGTLLQTVGNLVKEHEDNTKSLVLLNLLNASVALI